MNNINILMITLGVAALNRQIQDWSNFGRNMEDPWVPVPNKQEKMRIITAGMPALLRAWYRYVRYFWIWVADGPDKPLGPVKTYWYR